MTARFVRTQKEMEGRYEDVWVLVDEADTVESWPADADLALVGRPAARPDGAARASGRVRYTADVRLAGMLHAAVLRSPVAHGRVRSLDLDAARGTPGVRGVIGPESELTLTTRAPLLALEPMYAGQPIAVVAADTPEAARAGVRALALDVEVLPHVVDAQQAVNEQRFTAEPADDARGDSEAALAASEVTIELEMETPAQLQTALEPHGAVVSWDGDEITAWISTQGMFSAREELADAFGLRKDDVRVRTEFVGGGFGAKQGAGFEALAAAELARLTGRPVRLVNDRHAEQLDGGRRGATRQTIRLGASRDGTLTAIEVDAVVAMGQGGWMFPVVSPARTLYRCADVRALTFPAKTNLRAQNAFRAPGVMEGVAAFEQAMDELALALGLDPLELRRRNHVDVDQVERSSVLEQAAPRLLRPRRRACRLEPPRRAARAAGRRAPAGDGLRHADLVGRGRPALARDRAARRGRPCRRDHRHPGHRHRAPSPARRSWPRRSSGSPSATSASSAGTPSRTSTARSPAGR